MKKLFFSVFALTLGAFTLISCDDEKINGNKDEDGGRYMTVPEQQQAIQGALNGVADAIEFTEFSEALNVVSSVTGRKFNEGELYNILGSPAIAYDSIMQEKLVAMATIFLKDTIAVDLSPFNFAVDLTLKDTFRIDSVNHRGDTIYYSTFIVDTVWHDVEGAKLNLSVDGHEVVFKVDIKAADNSVTVKTRNGNKTVMLPKSAKLSLELDGKTLAAMDGQFNSDMSLYVEDVEEGDDIIELDGSAMSLKGNLNVLSYALEGEVNLDLNKGFESKLTARYSGQEVFSINGNIDAIFEGLDIQNENAVLAWAQKPDSLKNIGLNVSLAGGKVQIKGNIESPFKNEELATTLRSLMIPGATISDAKAKETIEQLNGVINAGIYFEGFKQPQAKLKFVFLDDEPGTKAKAEENNPFENIMELFARTGAYPVLIARDADGKEVEVQFEDYFGGIDVVTFANTVKSKFYQVFGPYMDPKGNKK